MLTVVRSLLAAILVLYGTAAPPEREQQRWVLTAINAEQAWPVSKGAGVTVAVIDSAVAPGTTGLKGKVTVAPDMSSPTLETTAAVPGEHGTAMAGLIAASGDRGGFIGVAPRARILSVPITVDETLGGDVVPPQEDLLMSRESPLARAIRYSVDHGAKVISMSIGTYGVQRSEREAVAYALDRGVVLVAAVGNDGETAYARANSTSYWTFPAGYPGVIGVSAVDRQGRRAAFSSDNASVMIAAPGVDVPVLRKNGALGSGKGTSVAAALVAGVAALVKSRYPNLPPSTVTQAITSSARARPSAGYDDKVGFGVVDAAAALDRAGELSGRQRGVPVPDDKHFGAGKKAPLPSPPGPSPWRMWLFGSGVVIGLIAFGGAVMLLSQRNKGR
ncbi:S8 family serine peptidase [Nonomuraea sp. NPDC003804]|uniref:S8 family serine peptidase n=1 Tax=Nonomuraea sp. NPDC003804 TaxID=3154547 RepID=UPI0033BC0D0E